VSPPFNSLLPDLWRINHVLLQGPKIYDSDLLDGSFLKHPLVETIGGKKRQVVDRSAPCSFPSGSRFTFRSFSFGKCLGPPPFPPSDLHSAQRFLFLSGGPRRLPRAIYFFFRLELVTVRTNLRCGCSPLRTLDVRIQSTNLRFRVKEFSRDDPSLRTVFVSNRYNSSSLLLVFTAFPAPFSLPSKNKSSVSSN